MSQTATAIPVPVQQGCCFETTESIGRSQQKSRLRQRCNTCGFTISKHMTRTQALDAFTAHAIAYPSTHNNLTIPLGEGMTPPASYAEQHGLQAPIPGPVQQPLHVSSVPDLSTVVTPVHWLRPSNQQNPLCSPPQPHAPIYLHSWINRLLHFRPNLTR